MSEARGEPVLVVDDAPQNVKLLRLILTDAGYRIIEAFSGPEALEKLRSEKPEAMILDVRMPGMTGYEVCRAVRSDPEFATLPVIMVTALSMPEERIKGIEAGATDFITKPFGKKELLARLQSSLAIARAEGRRGLDALGPVILTDPQGRVVAASARAAELLGYAVRELLGRDFRHILSEREATLSGESPEVANFRLRSNASRELSARTTPVADAEGNLTLHATVLGTGGDHSPESASESEGQ